MRLRSMWAVVCVGVVSVFIGGVAVAQKATNVVPDGGTLLLSGPPVADRVPEGSILYFGWRGGKNLGSEYVGSRAQNLLKASNLPAVFTEMLPKAILRVKRDQPEVARYLQIAVDITGPMWNYPTAFYFEGVDFAHPAFPMPKVGLVCRAGADAQKLHDQINGLLEQAGPSQVPIRVIVSGSDVALIIGYDGDIDPLAGPTSTALSATPAFKGALQQVHGENGVVMAYLDFEAILRLVDEGIVFSGNTDAAQLWPTIRDAAGLAGFKRMAQSCGFEQRDWVSRTFVDAPSPRTGLLTLCDSEPLSEELLKSVPQTASMMMAGSFDFAKLIPAFRQIAVAIDAVEGPKKFDQVIGATTLATGANLQKDVFEALGDQWAGYSDPNTAGNGLAGMVLVNKLRNPAKAQSGIMSLSLFASNSANTGLRLAGLRYLTFPAKRMTVEGTQVNYLPLPLVAPSWSIKDGNLYATFYPQVVLAAARQPKLGSSILDNETFNAMRKRLGVEKPTSISYIDLPRLAPDSYGSLLLLSQFVGAADLFGVDSPPLVVPTFDVFQKELTPSASASYKDDGGFHSISISPFPGAEVFGSGGGGGGEIFQIIGAIGPMIQASHR